MFYSAVTQQRFVSVTQVHYVCQFDDNSCRQMISNFSLKKTMVTSMIVKNIR